MNIFSWEALGCVFQGKSENGSLIQDHLDYNAWKEPKNPFPIGSFDAMWSKWSWINDPFSVFQKKQKPFNSFMIIVRFAVILK